MSHHSSKTVLKDRTLWFDGDSTYPASTISKALLGDIIPFVDNLSDEIRQYNTLVTPDKQVCVKTENRPFEFDWIIPGEYKNIDLYEYVTNKLMSEHIDKNFTDEELTERANRVCEELNLYKKHGLYAVLRVLIFIINTLTNQGVVWGVGRGSSVSSYVLYLLGVHDVDSVKYQLSITDFLH